MEHLFHLMILVELEVMPIKMTMEMLKINQNLKIVRKYQGIKQIKI